MSSLRSLRLRDSILAAQKPRVYSLTTICMCHMAYGIWYNGATAIMEKNRVKNRVRRSSINPSSANVEIMYRSSIISRKQKQKACFCTSSTTDNRIEQRVNPLLSRLPYGVA